MRCWTLGLAASVLVGRSHGFGWGLGGGSSEEKKHAVQDLAPDSFDKFMKDNPVTAVLFYAPWCFYSQQMMPAWDIAAQKLKLHDPPVHLAKIDAHRYSVIGDRYGVNSYPTLKLFVDESVFEYDGNQGRQWPQIVKWVNKHIDRDHVLKNAQDLEHYLHDNDLNVIGLFPDDHDSSTFVTTARHFEDVMFAESKGSDLSKELSKYISEHMTLFCETIDVGRSEKNGKHVALPRDGMTCTGQPKNPQAGDWTDSFAASVAGTQLTVNRQDADAGWGQFLQLKCCDQAKPDDKKPKVEVPIPSIAMFMPHDERFAIYDQDPHDSHRLTRWISARRTPMVMKMSPEVAEKIFDAASDKAPVLFLVGAEGEATDRAQKTLREVAKQLRGRTVVCFSGTQQPIEKRLMEMAGVEEDQLPVLTLIDMKHGGGGGPFKSAKKYRHSTEGMTEKSVLKWVSDFEQNKLKPWLRSEPVPEAMTGPLKVLVGSTFREVAHNAAKDVMVNFFAPWCGHCRKFEPNYKEFAKKLKHVPTLTIAKLDATRNEVEGMAIRGFPTVVLFPAGDNKERTMVEYHGDRSPEDLTRFLHKHATHAFTDTDPNPAGSGDQTGSGLLTDEEESDL